MTTRSTPVRRRTQLVLAGLGGLVFLLGVLVVASPRTAVRSRQALVELLGNDYFVVAVAGGLGLLVVLIVLGARARSGITQTAPPARRRSIRWPSSAQTSTRSSPTPDFVT